MKTLLRNVLLVVAAASLPPLAGAQQSAAPTSSTAQAKPGSPEAVIRKNLGARVPALAHIDEISPTPMPGLYEVRIGSNVLYSDAKGDYLIDGSLLDTRDRRDLTRERIDQLTAIDFKDLPFKDALAVVYGKGTRKMAAFEDPNCPYCKRFDKEMTQVDDATVYTFVIPILGPDSVKKAHQIWCSKDRVAAWSHWMIDNVALTGTGDCDVSTVEANLKLAQKLNVTATPTLFFASGKRVPGAIDAAQIEQLLGKK
ncbi:MAG: DsbC family protein [Burkholderiaceae bacterium]|nr:MAG: DsbC family protein [Burkholderiaceae bacterium]